MDTRRCALFLIKCVQGFAAISRRWMTWRCNFHCLSSFSGFSFLSLTRILWSGSGANLFTFPMHVRPYGMCMWIDVCMPLNAWLVFCLDLLRCLLCIVSLTRSHEGTVFHLKDIWVWHLHNNHCLGLSISTLQLTYIRYRPTPYKQNQAHAVVKSRLYCICQVLKVRESKTGPRRRFNIMKCLILNYKKTKLNTSIKT